MKKIIHSLITVLLAIFFIIKGFDKINSTTSSLNKTDFENIQKENYIYSAKGEKPSGYKITMNTMKQSGFLKMIGVTQILAGILLIIPITRLYGLLIQLKN